MEIIKIRAGEISLRDDGIIQLDITLEDELTAKEMSDIFFFTENISDEKHAMLVRHLVPHSLSGEAQKEISMRKEFSAVAIYASTPMAIKAGSYLTATVKTEFAMEVFSNEDEATAWLKGYM